VSEGANNGRPDKWPACPADLLSGRRGQSSARGNPLSYPLSLPSLPPPDLLPFRGDSEGNEQTRKFLLGVIQICLDYIEREFDRSERVIEFRQPDEIIRMFDFSIPDSPSDLDQLVEDCRRTLAQQVRTGK